MLSVSRMGPAAPGSRRLWNKRVRVPVRLNVATGHLHQTRGRALVIGPKAGLVAVLVAGPVLHGCTDIRKSNPDRTATEQLLLSTAVDRAVAKLGLGLPAETTAFVDESYFEAYDQGYAVAAIRDGLLADGVRLTTVRERADVIVEIRTGGLSIDQARSLIGLPAFDIPVPLAGDLSVPEVALMSRDRRRGVAKVAITAYWRDTGDLAGRAPPIIGVSGYDDWSVLGLGWRDGDEFATEPPDSGEPGDGLDP